MRRWMSAALVTAAVAMAMPAQAAWKSYVNRELGFSFMAPGEVKAAVGMLSNMDNAKAIMIVCQDIDRLESEADHVMRSAMAKLFRDEPDVKQVMKMRSVYEMLETVTDRCEDVANLIQGIVLENS